MTSTWQRRVRMAGLAAVGIAALAAGPLEVTAGPKPTPPKPTPESARVELGRRLFFDPAASRTGTRSCADCHDPAHGYSDVEAISRDARGATPRRTQTLVDCVDSPTMDWLGAFKRIEDVVAARSETGPATPVPPYYGGVITPTDPSLQFVSPQLTDAQIPLPHQVLSASGRYRNAFEAAYSESKPTPERVVGAISAYCRSIKSGESAYDRYAAGDKAALSQAAIRGLELFQGKAACSSCHSMEGKRATFSDYKFHQTGLREVAASTGPATFALTPAFANQIAAILRKAGVRNLPPEPGTPLVLPAPPPPPVVATPRGGFKTPTLRDVAERAPYMHNGSLKTLEAVVRFFLPGRTGDRTDDMMPTYAANEAEISDIVEFLKSLSSATRPGAPRVAWSQRARRTQLHVVDVNGRALPRWPIVLTAAGDTLPGAPAQRETLRLVTDGDGWVSYAPPLSTHVRVVLEGGLQPEGGCWIPDTCTSTRVTLPISGTGHIRVTMPADAPVPETLELAHEGATIFPDRREPKTTLRKDAVVEVSGEKIVVYSGVVRTDVLPTSTLRLPPGFRSGGKRVERVTMGPTTTIALRFER